MTRLLLGGTALLHALVVGGPARRQLPGPEASTITLLTINQPPCTVPTPHTVIKAKLAYHLAEGEQSDYGFAVSLKFQTTTPGRTYSQGQLGMQTITRHSDTLTIRYPLASVWSDTRLRRPITCYFYLHRNTGPGRSRVVAQTPAIILQECQ